MKPLRGLIHVILFLMFCVRKSVCLHSSIVPVVVVYVLRMARFIRGDEVQETMNHKDAGETHLGVVRERDNKSFCVTI